MSRAKDPRLVDFGYRVRTLRENMGWSQEDLAERAGVHRTYVGSVERGERNVTLRSIYALAAALKVTPADLLLGRHDP